MITLTSDFIKEKNKLSNKPITLYEIVNYNDGNDSLYLTSYDEDVVFNSITYIKFPITHEAISENTTGEIDTVNVRVSNVSKEIQGYLELYDLRSKAIIISTVFANLLDNSLNVLPHTYYVDSVTAGVEEVNFACTSKFDLLKLEIPARKYWRNHCSWKFKGTECAYAGEATSCNKTFTACKALANSLRFGGFPSIPSRQVFLG